MIKKFVEFIEESYGNRTSNEIAEIDKLAIRYFGTTKNFKIGGYVMRDGTILDFSESNMGSDGLDRYADHRYINRIIFDYETDKKISDIESPDIWEYIDLGNIRINYPSGFDLSQPMTPEQEIVMRRYIQDCARRSRNGFYVTIFKEGKAQKYFEYDKIYADMADVILRDIYDYFNSNSNK
jgi:hypothetical protein